MEQEKLISLSKFYKEAIGVDIDEQMVKTANDNSRNVLNISFTQDSEKLENIDKEFSVILNRHAPFCLSFIKKHLGSKGYFITQQVGKNNMLNIKKVLNQQTTQSVISKEMITLSGLRLIAFMEYDVEYIVQNVESLVFWLRALDMLHADINAESAIDDVSVLNKILQSNFDNRGFITNEHRYLVIAQK